MAERLLITILLIVAGLALYRLIIFLQMRRARSALPGLEGYQPGKYLILYFTSPTCAPCKTVQQPALNTVRGTFGDQLQIITIDVTEQPAAADHWGVMTLPTTLLFDNQGAPNGCNLGVAYADKLIKQIANMGAQTEIASQNYAL